MKGIFAALIVFGVLSCVTLSAQQATAADISSDTLAEMGLADMQPMSDAEGMEVRGQGVIFLRYSSLVNVSRNFVSFGSAIVVQQNLNIGPSTNIALLFD